jgi:hypothetical protein
MKNSILLLFLIGLFFNSIFSQIIINKPRLPCPNGGAESNNFSSWATYTGTSIAPQTNNGFIQNFDANRFGVHANTGASANFNAGVGSMIVNGNDNYGGFAIPNEGTYCFRLGNNATNAQSELMRYSFTVNTSNALFKFRYAVVLEDNGHPIAEQPNLTFYMNRGVNIDPSTPADFTLYNSTVKSISADVGDPFFNISPIQNNVVYRGWQCVQYDLTAYIGQAVSFCARIRDCSQGGHFGYAYIDGLCATMPAIASFTLPSNEFCLQEPIIMNASASTGEDRYFVEIIEVETGIVQSDWYVNEPAPAIFDLKGYYTSKFKTFKCGNTYRIKLAVSSECAPWNETTKIIKIVCPTVNLGSDKTYCCNSEGLSQDPLILGEIAQNGYAYSWVSTPAGLISGATNTSQISVNLNNLTQSGSYFVSKYNAKGCVANDEVIVRVKPRYTIQIAKLPYQQCDNRTHLKANLTPVACPESAVFLAQYPQNDASTVKWYFKPANSTIKTYLGTGATWAAPNVVDGTMYAEYQDACPSSLTSASIAVTANPESHDHTLYAPNTFTPDDGNVNNVFRIIAGGPTAPINIGDGPAYDAIDFKLRFWNRWGVNFLTIDKAYIGRTGPLMQGDIKWDGKLNGTVMEDAVYNYTLEMQYCGTSHFQPALIEGCQENQCVRWTIFGICIQHISGCSKFVTLIK